MTDFWKTKDITEMTNAEWESLCDGCGLCCQISAEDISTGELAVSNVACKYLDLCTHQCKSYTNRQELVKDCIKVTPQNVDSLYWLPGTCGYRLVAAGFDLPSWHHLKCGDRMRVHKRGPSMMGNLISETEAEW